MEYKTVEDLFADSEKVVYHYFPASKKESILKNGLLCSMNSSFKSGEKKGIYVVWSDDLCVRNAIAQTQCGADSKGNLVGPLCQLAINLKKYGITAKDIAPDLNGLSECDINSFCCKIIKDIPDIAPVDIIDWRDGSADTYGIEFYNLDGYNIDHIPTDYEFGVAVGYYQKRSWKDYK